MSRQDNFQRYADERMAQQIRDNNQTLRALESKIRAIYVSKGIGVQLAEQEKERLQQRLDMETERQQLRQAEVAHQQQERKLAFETRKRQAKQRIDLQEQMADKQAKRRLLYEEFLREKIIIDEIMAQIQQEQIEEMQAKLRRSERFKSDLLDLIKEQEMWKRDQERIHAEENEKIVEYIEQRDRHAEIQRQAEQHKLHAMLEQQERMADALNDIEQAKMEHEELLIELKAHELEEKQTTLDRKRLEDEIRRRLDAKLGLEEQIRDVELRRALRAAEEEEFHLEQQRLVAEQDRLELLTREAQRSKKLENQRALRDLLERREASRKAQIAQLIQEHNDLIELEKRRQEIFERERLRILQRHADDIIGFLPRELLEANM